MAGRTRGRERRQGDSDLEGASSGRWRGWESGRGRRRRRVRSPRCRVRDAQETRAPARGGMLRASRPPRARAWVDAALGPGGPGVGPRLRLAIGAWMGGRSFMLNTNSDCKITPSTVIFRRVDGRGFLFANFGSRGAGSDQGVQGGDGGSDPLDCVSVTSQPHSGHRRL